MQIKGLNRPTSTADATKIFDALKAENAMSQGDVVQFSDTDDATYPIGATVEDAASGSYRIAGVVINSADVAAGDYALVQCYGYCENITTDGNVASTDVVLIPGAAVAVGQTAAEVDAAGNSAVLNVFAWNVKTDSGTVGEGFIKAMGM